MATRAEEDALAAHLQAGAHASIVDDRTGNDVHDLPWLDPALALPELNDAAA